MGEGGQAKYRRHPAYKASGVEWLEDIPEGWSHAPLKYMALEENSLFLDGNWIESKDLSDDGIRYITTGNVGEGDYKEQGGGYISEKTFKTLNASEVFEGDILVSRLNAPIGRACIVPDLSSRIVTSVDNVIFRPDSKFHRSFVVYMLSSREYFGHTSNMARGATMQRISRGLLGNIRIVFPPLNEQTKIAAFLDHETAKIDALIDKQQRLIALLEEKRQAVISHAVTKGLDPDAALRPSGIEWLGDVPAHWETRKVSKLTTKITNGYVGPTRDILFEEGVPYVQATHVKRGKVNFDNAYFVKEKWSNKHSKSILKTEDVLIVQTGAGTGDVACVTLEEEGYNCHALIILTPMENVINGRYLAFALRSQYGQAVLFSIRTGGMHPHLNCGEVQYVPLPLPLMAEQVLIANFIEDKTQTFDEMNIKAQSAITLLKERRTALISAAVTGKIDLRDWQPSEGTDDHSAQDIEETEEATA